MAESGWWERLVEPDRPPGAGDRLALLGLSAAAALYRGGSAAHRSLARLRGSWQPPVPTVCVGNITVGGTGKTTATRFLARRLLARGLRVAVTLRGYGREGACVQAVAHDGRETSAHASEVGDEAAMLGASLGTAVVLVGRSRVESARRAVEEFGAQVLVLDDGLQHWAIAPHLRLALWDATQDPRAARLFPRGRLREPLGRLARVDHVLLTRYDVAPRAEEVRGALERIRGAADVICAIHRPTRLVTVDGRTEEPPTALRGLRVFAASSLGNPRALRMTLERLGAAVVGERVFPDHHLYAADDTTRVLAEARQARADRVIVTEKDLVKLRELAGAEEMSALVVELEILEPPAGAGPAALCAALDRLTPGAERVEMP